MSAAGDFSQDYAAHWDLINKIPLNHGSFGATPVEILKRLAEREKQFNRDRERFMWHELASETIRVRAALAAFVGAASGDDLVLVDNITEGFNTVIRSLPLGAGDEVLITNHIYSPYAPPLRDYAARQGFAVKTVNVPYPPRDDDEIIAAILAGVTKNTKLAIVDHISSPTAIIFPVKRIVAALGERGVDCFVDGAHAPGQVPVNVAEIGAAYYSANNHKWICAPVASGFLHVRADRQDNIVPVIASYPGHRDAPFAERFSWQGTKDLIPRLLVPETIEYMAKLHPQGWEGIFARNHALAVAARDIMAEALGIAAPYPDHMFGSLFTLPLGALQFDAQTETLEAGRRLSAVLEKRTGLRAYGTLFEGQYLLRLSAHLYNNIGHYQALVAVLPGIVAEYAAPDKREKIMAESLLNVENSLMQARWVYAPAQQDLIDRIARQHGLPEIIARLLAARGIAPEQVESFLRPTLARDFPDPLKMVGMKAAAEYLAQAVIDKRKIGVFGDFDVDGATSTALLVRFFRHCGLAVPIYIPDRTKEGYGPNISALQTLKAQGVELVIMCDCGITAHEVIAQGRALGLNIIVLDHHQAEDKLPPANHVINPNRKDDKSGLGMLAACGVTFMTCVAVNAKLRDLGWFKKQGIAEAPLKDWLDIVALGTVCDMVPLTGANRLFVRFGLQRMAQTTNPGIRALCAVAAVKGTPSTYHCGFALGPRINAGSRVHQADLGARLLSTDDAEEAKNISFTLNDCNDKRKLIQNEMSEHAVRMVEEGQLHQHAVIIVGHEDWHPGLSGLVAGKLREKYDRPAVVVTYAPGMDGRMEGRGSGRSVPGVNMGAAFIDARNSDIAIKGGGHAMAAGFTIMPERLDDLRAFLQEHISRQLAGQTAVTDTLIDGVVSVRGVKIEFVKLLEDSVGPFGQGHDEPVFALSDVRLHMVDIVGTDHVRCVVSDWEGGSRIKAVAFRAAGTPLGDALLHQSRDKPFHLTGHFKINEWQGRENVEMHIQDAAFAMPQAAAKTVA